MNRDFQFQLHAYLDGELPEAERRSVEGRLQQDAAARDLLAELRLTRSLVAGQERAPRVPESREFYWSKISRQIERETARPEAPARRSAWLRWLLSPASGAVASLLLLAAGGLWLNRPGESAANEAEVSLPEGQMVTFRDQEERMTVVWLTYNE
jgi:anti-sigma factor RsiW